MGLVYDNGLIFHGVEYLDRSEPAVLHEGETQRVRLWWSAERALDRDYSAGLYLMTSSGDIVSQQDGPPGGDTVPGTSDWEVGRFYVEERTVQSRFPTQTGSYRLRLVVYHWQDLERVDAPGLSEDRLLTLGRVQVVAW